MLKHKHSVNFSISALFKAPVKYTPYKTSEKWLDCTGKVLNVHLKNMDPVPSLLRTILLSYLAAFRCFKMVTRTKKFPKWGRKDN